MWIEPCEETECFMHGLERRNPGELDFHQAVLEFVETVMPFVLEHRKYKEAQILERMTEPDRIVIFRVTCEDDNGNIRANRAWRVQFNNSIGPYKGGLRFEVDTKLKTIMRDIHAKCVLHGQTDKMVNYVRGSNIAGFIKVADAMLAYGVV